MKSWSILIIYSGRQTSKINLQDKGKTGKLESVILGGEVNKAITGHFFRYYTDMDYAFGNLKSLKMQKKCLKGCCG